MSSKNIENILKCKNIRTINQALRKYIGNEEECKKDIIELFKTSNEIVIELKEKYRVASNMYVIEEQDSAVMNFVLQLLNTEYANDILNSKEKNISDDMANSVYTHIRRQIKDEMNFIEKEEEPLLDTKIIKGYLMDLEKEHSLLNFYSEINPLYILKFNSTFSCFDGYTKIYGENKNMSSHICLFSKKHKEKSSELKILGHELGHSIHMAITGNLNEIPKEFKKINKKHSKKIDYRETHAKDAFADSIMIGLMYNEKYKNNLSENILGLRDKNIRDYIEMVNKFSEKAKI